MICLLKSRPGPSPAHITLSFISLLMNVLECALIWDPHLCVSLESLEKALAILSLYITGWIHA